MDHTMVSGTFKTALTNRRSLTARTRKRPPKNPGRYVATGPNLFCPGVCEHPGQAKAQLASRKWGKSPRGARNQIPGPLAISNGPTTTPLNLNHHTGPERIGEKRKRGWKPLMGQTGKIIMVVHGKHSRHNNNWTTNYRNKFRPNTK